MESIKKSGNLLSVIVTIGVIALGAVALVRYGDTPKVAKNADSLAGSSFTGTQASSTTAETICEKIIWQNRTNR
jgi:hypothetical protein